MISLFLVKRFGQGFKIVCLLLTLTFFVGCTPDTENGGSNGGMKMYIPANTFGTETPNLNELSIKVTKNGNDITANDGEIITGFLAKINGNNISIVEMDHEVPSDAEEIGERPTITDITYVMTSTGWKKANFTGGGFMPPAGLIPINEADFTIDVNHLWNESLDYTGTIPPNSGISDVRLLAPPKGINGDLRFNIDGDINSQLYMFTYTPRDRFFTFDLLFVQKIAQKNEKGEDVYYGARVNDVQYSSPEYSVPSGGTIIPGIDQGRVYWTIDSEPSAEAIKTLSDPADDGYSGGYDIYMIINIYNDGYAASIGKNVIKIK